jgi:hypothetical protein
VRDADGWVLLADRRIVRVACSLTHVHINAFIVTHTQTHAFDHDHTCERSAKAMATYSKMPEYAKKGGSLDKQMARQVCVRRWQCVVCVLSYDHVALQAERFTKNGGHFAMFELLYMRRDLVKMNK